MHDVFLAIAGLCIATGLGLSFFHISRSAQRRIYWAAAGVAGLSGFFIGYPNMKNAVVIAALLLATMTVIAYVSTPYLKIGGKIYALTISDRRPDPEESRSAHDSPTRGGDGAAHPADPAPDSYSGLLTPTTMWWVLVGLALIAAGNTYGFLFSNGEAAPAAVSAGLLALVAVGAGYGDASWDYPIARRQYLPFGVAALLTAGTFALVYLAAYYTARRLPLRRTQSLEYRAHPRHRKPDSEPTTRTPPRNQRGDPGAP